MFHEYGDILTVDDLMEMLQLGRNSVYRLLKDGHIKSIKMGRIHRIPRDQVIEYIIQKCK